MFISPQLIKISNQKLQMTTEHTTEPVTIVTQANTIIISHPQVKQEKGALDQFSGLFAKDPVSTEIQKQGVQAFGDDTYVPPEQGQTSTWTNLFNVNNRAECKKIWHQKVSQFADVDDRLANSITQFKQQYLLTLGDIRVRSVLMAFSSAVLYKLISCNTTGLLRKSRNLAVSFAFMGYWFVPQLFNPFLRRPISSQNVV